MMPRSMSCTNSLFSASYPKSPSPFKTFSTITFDSTPAFLEIVRAGIRKDFLMISIPVPNYKNTKFSNQLTNSRNRFYEQLFVIVSVRLIKSVFASTTSQDHISSSYRNSLNQLKKTSRYFTWSHFRFEHKFTHTHTLRRYSCDLFDWCLMSYSRMLPSNKGFGYSPATICRLLTDFLTYKWTCLSFFLQITSLHVLHHQQSQS